MKKTTNTKANTKAQNTKANEKKTEKTINNFLDVTNTLNALQYDAKRFEVIRKYDNEEFNENTKERTAYANIRETDTKRSILKLWGHKTYTTVECSKMLRKREQINVDKKIYTEKKIDKNNNYICESEKDIIALANDFLTQVDKMLSTTVTEKTTNEKVKSA